MQIVDWREKMAAQHLKSFFSKEARLARFFPFCLVFNFCQKMIFATCNFGVFSGQQLESFTF